MKPVIQTRFDNKRGNCTQACIASILEIPLDSVPDCYGTYWQRGYNKWLFKQFGLAMITVEAGGLEEYWYQIWLSGKYYHIIGGQSPRLKCQHAVVGLNGKIVHDPHPDGTGLKTIDNYDVFVIANPRNSRRGR